MTFETFLSDSDIAALQKQEAAASRSQKRTPEQIEAIYSQGNNILVSASAGSGKTFVMVERIIDKIKRGVAVNQLFISTFTVKAADELKERLEKKLRQLLAETADNQLRQHLSSQLADIQNADIGTMDAFTQKLVSQYGYLLGISPHFRILTDKSEQDSLKDDVYSQLFEAYYQGTEAQTFRALVKNFSAGSKSSKPFQRAVDRIYSFSQSTSKPEEWLKTNFLKGYERFKSEDSLPDDIQKNVLAKMQQAAQDLEELTQLEDYKQVTAKGQPTAAYKKHQQIFQQLYDWSATPNHFSSLSQLTQAVTALIPSGNDITVAGIKYPIFSQLHTELTSIRHLATVLTYQSQALPLLACLQRFVLDFTQAYLQRKIEEGCFEFSDISHFAIQILEDSPDIRRLYQEHYHEIMVDEYQDNSHTQERMLDLLSNGRNRFMVGDIKQSIYRFRQADPQIFRQKFKLFQDNPEAGKLILLKENFRSQNEVLEAANSLFSHLMDEDIGDINYDEQHRLIAGSERQRIVQPANQTELLIYDTDEEGSEQETDKNSPQPVQVSPNEINLVIKEIIRLHNERGAAFDEITLLVPSRTRNDSIIAAFSQHGIPLVTDSGEQNYLKSLEVQVMLDTLRSLDNPLNDYALAALLRSPMFHFDEDELARLALQIESGAKQANFYEKLTVALAGTGQHAELITPQFRSKLEAFEMTFQKWRTAAKLRSLHDLIWQIYNEKFYYDYVGALPDGEQRQANLYALALRADSFERTGFKGLSRFITMIDKILENDNDLADVPVSLPKNAVQLMTIHKSKGLEFKYVFLLNMDKSFFSNRRENNPSLLISREHGIGIKQITDLKAEFEEQTPLPSLRVSMETLPYQVNRREERLAALSENMRLLYVAMTRAETKLYLIGKGSRSALAGKFDSKTQSGRLTLTSREQLESFQDWFLAVSEALGHREDLHYQISYVSADELTADKIGELAQVQTIHPDKLQNSRQSTDIAAAIKQLEEVDQLNQAYRAAIHLPTVRTPSQIKKFYQPVLDEDRLDIMSEEKTTTDKLHVQFELPTFGQEEPVTAAAIGSATHELMQRLPLDRPITLNLLEETLDQVQASPHVKSKLRLEKILAFFDTDLGRLIQAKHQQVRREAPFAMLVKDPVSQEKIVVRGIIDGFIKESDKIILFDYKTDQYSNPKLICERYQEQMALYADALRKSYNINHIDKYLVLLGGDKVEIHKSEY